MTEYGIKLLKEGRTVTLQSTGLPYGIEFKHGDLIVKTNEASMIIPIELLNELIDIKSKLNI